MHFRFELAKKYKSNLRLMIYLVGVSDDLERFIAQDPSLSSRIQQSIVNLLPGRKDEYLKIKEKIDKRIEGIYRKYTNFEEVQQELQRIRCDAHANLREFCKRYAIEMLKIYGKYFQNIPESYFEGSNEELLEIAKLRCEKHWDAYFQESNFNLSVTKNSSKNNDYTFYCYGKLIKDGQSIANAYMGARNCELLSGYVDEFIRRLEEVDFLPFDPNGNPKDIAFIVAPDCSFLLKARLEANNIHLVNSSYQADPLANEATKNEVSSVNPKQSVLNNRSFSLPVDINLANKQVLTQTFENLRFGLKSFEAILENRPYTNGLNELFDIKFDSGRRVITSPCQVIIREMYDQHKICFRTGAFISYNSKDKQEIQKILKRLDKEKISYWKDDQLLGGVDVRKELENKIESDTFWAAIVFIGAHGVGRWQDEEISALVRKLVERNHPVIPVVLESCGSREPSIPGLLKNRNYIDLRHDSPQKLVDSIKGSDVFFSGL